MVYVRHIPSSPLDEYVNYFYCLDGSMPSPHARIVPLPSFDLKFNFGGVVRMFEPTRPERAASFNESWCVGVWSESHAVDWPLDMQITGVSLKPAGAWMLFNLPLYELHNQVVTLDRLWGNFATEVWERLYTAPTRQARFALLEQVLLARLYDTSYNFKIVRYAVSQIARHQGAVTIHSLSKDVGLSQTHLTRLFKQMVGALPKELARLYRFQHVLHSIDVSRPVDWTGIAHQCGFYDQAHFSREFTAFSGARPTDYLKLRRQLYAENPEHVPLYRNLPIG
jgi:AraC-like DNA-binding protein